MLKPKTSKFKNESTYQLFTPFTIFTSLYGMHYMKKWLLPVLFIAIIASISSCKKENDTAYSNDLTRGYYPLQKGHYVLYDVDSTIYDDFSQTATLRHSQVRYDVADTFLDNQNRVSYQVEVRQRLSDSTGFLTNDVFFVTPTPNGLDVVQNNVRFTKLIFPVAAGKSWEGNRQIPTADKDLQFYNGWFYTYYNIGNPYNTGRAQFENTVTVQEVNDSLNSPELMPDTYAERRFAKEIYAYNVGLVYREFIQWVYDQNPSTQNYYRKGTAVVMRAVEHN